MVLNIKNTVYDADFVSESYIIEDNASEVRLAITLNNGTTAPQVAELATLLKTLNKNDEFFIENNEPVKKIFIGYSLESISNEIDNNTSNYTITFTKSI
jgi:hypothetical protein